MARHQNLFSVQSLMLVVTLFAMASFLIVPLHAQQPAPPPSADNQTTEGSAQKAPPAATVQPAKASDAPFRPAPAGEGIPALVVDGTKVLGVLGKQVRSSAGEDMGRIVDVIIDRSARVRAAVIDFGGFLGVGNRQIAVAWSAIRLPAEDKPGALVVDFTRDQLRVAPTYKAGEQVVLLGQVDVPPALAGNGAADKDGAPKEPASK
jgi:hypothetical protein